MFPLLQQYKIVLGSASPRRKELLAGLDIPFSIRLIPGIKESYPADAAPFNIPVFISQKKAEAYIPTLADDELLITADTIVWSEHEVLGKPSDRNDAVRMLRQLSGRVHQVITGVNLVTKQKQASFSSVSDVTFAELSDEEIDYYIDKYRPYDKAGAYGVQEWIGFVGVESIRGSFFNVMGLPIQRLYREMKKF
jgi:septum formation protein